MTEASSKEKARPELVIPNGLILTLTNKEGVTACNGNVRVQAGGQLIITDHMSLDTEVNVPVILGKLDIEKDNCSITNVYLDMENVITKERKVNPTERYNNLQKFLAKKPQFRLNVLLVLSETKPIYSMIHNKIISLSCSRSPGRCYSLYLNFNLLRKEPYCELLHKLSGRNSLTFKEIIRRTNAVESDDVKSVIHIELMYEGDDVTAITTVLFNLLQDVTTLSGYSRGLLGQDWRNYTSVMTLGSAVDKGVELTMEDPLEKKK